MIAENASSPGGGTARSAARTRAARPGVARLLNSDRARFGSWLPWLHARTVSGEPQPLSQQPDVG